jgi:hypothetical protein
MKKILFTFIAALSLATSTFAQLGSLSADLVFTPITPCRIVDTRNAGGAITAGTSRDFLAWNTTYTGQGGASTNCGMLYSRNVAAVALNLVVVGPAADGWIAAYPAGATRPNVSNLNYKAGDVLANSAILKINQDSAVASGYDWTLYSTSTTHFVADVTGYYSKPTATALNCNTTASSTVAIAAGATADAYAPACASGFTLTGTNCRSSSYDVHFAVSDNGQCSAKSANGAAQTITATARCCQVPGR